MAQGLAHPQPAANLRRLSSSRAAGLAVCSALVLVSLGVVVSAAAIFTDYGTLAATYSAAVGAMWLVVTLGEVAVNGGSLLSVKTLFYTALCYFHSAGVTFFFVRRTTPERYAAAGFVATAVALAAAGLASLWLRPAAGPKRLRLTWTSRTLLLAAAILHLTGWAAFAVFVRAWGFQRFLFGYGPYAGLDMGQDLQPATHFRVLAWTLWTVSLWLLAMQWMERRNRWVWLAAIVAALPVLMLLVAGYRGQALRTLVGLLLLRHLRRRYSLKTIVVIGLGAMVVIGATAMVRGAGALQAVGAQLAERAPQFGFFLARAGSLTRIVAATIERVGVVEDYALGREYVTQFVGKLLPVVGWKIAPWPTLRNVHPGVWASYYCWQNFRPDVTMEMVGTVVPGLGFSLIAEAYLNFGWPGIIAIPMLFVLFAAQLDRWLLRSDPITEIVFLQLAANLLMATRGSIEQLLDAVTVVVVVVLVLRVAGDAVSREIRALSPAVVQSGK